jgi:NTE family protein
MTRALVLGGGGPIGIAWESGLVAGLAEGGVDLSTADFIMGTSAGSVVGAQLAMGRPPSALYTAITAHPPQPATQPGTTPSAPPVLTPLMELMQQASAGKIAPAELRRKIGEFALAAQTITEEEFLASFGRMLASSGAWPERPYACTAVDAVDGSFILWDKAAGAPLNRAVASSCSVPGIYPPITINGRRYIDGGMRSATNADCAKDYDTVVVVAVTTDVPGPMGDQSRARLAAELQTLRDAGRSVECLQPDAGSRAAFGPNLMDFSRRTASAEAGYAQGQSAASSLRAMWDA